MSGYIISDKNEINVKNYKIISFDILHKTDLNIFVIVNNRVLYKNSIIFNASGHGHVKVLEWFRNSGYVFKYNEWSINYASENGNVQVLEWFKNSGYEFKYDEYAINYAFANGHIQVLEWFINSGYKFKYNKQGIYRAYEHKKINILKFFSKNFNIKKLIKWSSNIFIKTIKFKTHNKYFKGYQKN
jgi:hypothetical protein